VDDFKELNNYVDNVQMSLMQKRRRGFKQWAWFDKRGYPQWAWFFAVGVV